MQYNIIMVNAIMFQIETKDRFNLIEFETITIRKDNSQKSKEIKMENVYN